jgi:hypothetical protein
MFVTEQANLLEDISLNTSADRMGTDPEIFKQLGDSVRLQWLEIESLKRTVEDISLRTETKTKRKTSKKTGRKTSTKIKKYPAIFSTPPSKRKGNNSVRFSIEDTDF